MPEDTPVKKDRWFSVKNIVTGVLSLGLGTAGTFGLVNYDKIQNTITRAQAREVAMQAAAYSAETAATEAIKLIKSDVTLVEKAKAVTKATSIAVQSVKDRIDIVVSGVVDDAKDSGLTKENLTGAVSEVKAGIADAKEKVTETVTTVKSAVTKTADKNTASTPAASTPDTTPTATTK